MAFRKRTVVLNDDLGRMYREAVASVASYPGYLLELTSDSPQKCRPHTTRAGKVMRMVAVEDAYVGNTVDTQYAIGALVRYELADVGSRYALVLKLGENVAAGDWAISLGDGTVGKAAASILSNALAASTAVTNTVTETTFSNGSVVLPAGSLKVGDRIRVRAQGIATATHTTDTLQIKLYLGATAIADTGALDVADNAIFTIDVTITIRTIGASGTYVVNGAVAIGVAGTATMKEVFLGSTAIDTTVANTLADKATWSVADAGNSVRQDVFQVDQVGSSSGSSSSGYDVVGTFEEALDLSAAGGDDNVAVCFR